MSWLRCMFGKEREELHPNSFKPLPDHQNPSQPFVQQPQPQPQSHPGHPTTQHPPHLVGQPSFSHTQNRNSYLPPLPPETASPVQGPYHVDRQSQQNFQLSQTGYQHPSMQSPNFNGISHRESRSTISTVVDDVPVVNSNRSSIINGLADNMGTLKLSSGDNLIPGVKFVVGFDFGTTFSGFAVYRIDQGGKEMSKVKDSLIGKDDWVKQPQGVFSQKCPTVIAYNAEDKQLVWGWVAKRLNHPKFRRVERVKLCLEPSTPENMKPVLPESMNALDVVTDYLREMNKECLALIQKVYPVDAVNMAPEHILYCFTVPVGWSHTAHQSLRKAAFRAGLLKEEKSPLVFTYEPEAAALACYYESPIPIPEHSTMLVVDCGGGTVDTFMCRLGEQGDLCEVTLGLGEMIGATFVDANFFNYIRKVIGYGPFEKFRTSPQFRHAFDKLDSDWETMKRQFAGESTYNFNPYDHINLPHSLLKIMPADKVEAIPDDGIRIGLKEMKSFFDPVIDKILKLVKDQISQLKEEGHGSIDFLFIVGGFGCNQYLRDRILNDYEVKQYVKFAPQKIKAEAAVLRGAVWSGVDHQIIRHRKARKTIGVGVWRRYDESMDDPSEVVARDPNNPEDRSKWQVAKAVYAFVRKGQTISYDSVFVRPNFSIVPSHTSRVAHVNIYSTDIIPTHSLIEASQCEHVGTIAVDINPNSLNYSNGPNGPLHGMPKFSIEIEYGKVELTVKVYQIDIHGRKVGNPVVQILNHGHITIR